MSDDVARERIYQDWRREIGCPVSGPNCVPCKRSFGIVWDARGRLADVEAGALNAAARFITHVWEKNCAKCGNEDNPCFWADVFYRRYLGRMIRAKAARLRGRAGGEG
jgi:hypothetical protein